MSKIRPSIWFFICWFALQTALGQWNFIANPPEGMHQGAQADRACVAWNYHHESMNFFEPRVSENRNAEGVAGMEFPVINYTAGVFFKFFGFQNLWYRLLVFFIVTLGIFAAWAITGFFIQKNLHRITLVFGWYLSPILVFYSANFIPDPVAMSFCMMGWYYFLRFYFNIHVKASLSAYIVFATLAGLIKITFLIGHFAIFFLFIFYRYRPAFFPLGFPKIKHFFLWFMAPFLPVLGWYYYANYLTLKTNNLHFLQQINPAQSWSIFKANSRYSINTWQDSIYAPGHIYIILGILLICLFFRWKQAPIPGLITVMLFIGFLTSFVLFNNQYRYHDYYYILLFPSLFFGMIFLQQVFLEQKNVLLGFIPIMYFIGFFYLPITGYSHSKNMLAERHRQGSYYCQEVFTGIQQYPEFQQKIKSLIPEKAEVISVFDPSPNTSLYFLQKRGIRIAQDFSPELARDIIRHSRIQYMVLNDSLLWESKYQKVVNVEKELLYRKGILSLWKLKY